MTKVDLITGFLGAGKTTFIKKYADYLQARGEKVHIIENEFGGISIDAPKLRRENCDVSQITGGCMCCTGKVSFQNLLLQAANTGYDRILVEPSGIYDVEQFFSTVESEPVNTRCEVGNIVTIVDSVVDDILSEEARILMFSQLIHAGCVVMSKTQLRSPQQIAAAGKSLQDILDKHGSCRNLEEEEVCIVKPWDSFTQEDMERIAGCGARTLEHTFEAMDHMTIFSTSIMNEKFDTLDHLQEILEQVLNSGKYGRVYRIKGYIADLNKNWYEINCSCSGCFVQKASVRRGVFLVIGQEHDEHAIKELFRTCRKD